MSFDILNRRTLAVMYHGDRAVDMASALREALTSGANLEGAYLRGAYLEGACLEGANLRGAYLRGANLEDANLEDANLRDADLRGADLRGANLEDANLRDANLRGANLEGAYLRYANLEGAYLRDANLEGANLEGADLRYANLEGAYLEGADLRGAKGLLPNGITPLQIGGSKHWLMVRTPGYITIGCLHQTVEWWEENYAATGRTAHYTAEQIAEYRRHIQYAKEWMALNDVLKVIEAATP